MHKTRIPTELILLSFSGKLDEDRNTELQSWLQNPENQRVYDSLKRFHADNRQKLRTVEPDGEYLWKRLQYGVGMKRRLRKAVIVSASSVAAIFLIIISASLFISRKTVSAVDALVSIESVSGKSKAVLPDGTVVWLNGRSSIGYDKKKFGRRDRIVNLCGEAFFEVEKNTSKPFMVNSGGLTVTVTGTKFNVEETEKEVNVSLKEGSVDLSVSDGQKLSMQAGQKAGYDRVSGRLMMLEGQVASDICWAKESLAFNGNTLGYVCRYLSSWYGVTITLDPKLHENFAYTFTVVDEPLEEILRIMAEINPIKYTRQDDGSWFLSSLKD